MLNHLVVIKKQKGLINIRFKKKIKAKMKIK